MALSRHFILPFLLIFFWQFFSGCQALDWITPSSSEGVYHTVQEGQTLYRIAQTYEMNVDVLKRINGIRDPSQLKAGTRLWIPGANRVLTVPPTAEVARKRVPRAKKKSKPRPAVKNYLTWPVNGTLTSRYGNRRGRHHDGIDIATKQGTPIKAAANGKVVFSGWGPTGYGLMVIIKHDHHLTTVYAHNSKNLVRKGNRVNKGQIIARIGSTGRSTGPHLHFEVRNDTHPRDPLLYLSKH